MTAVTAAAHSGVRSPRITARAAERQAEPYVAVTEVEVLVRVGLPGPPLLDRGGGDRRQVIKRRPGRRGLKQDLVGLVVHFYWELPRPAGDRLGPGRGEVPGCDGVVQARAAH